MTSKDEIIEKQPEKSHHLVIFEGQCKPFSNEVLYRCHNIEELLPFAVVEDWHLVDIDGTMKGNPFISDFPETVLANMTDDIIQENDDILQILEEKNCFHKNSIITDSDESFNTFLVNDFSKEMKEKREEWLQKNHSEYYTFIQNQEDFKILINDLKDKIKEEFGEVDLDLFNQSFPLIRKKGFAEKDDALIGLEYYSNEISKALIQN